MPRPDRNPRPLAFTKRALAYFLVWVVLLGDVSVGDAAVGILVALAAASLGIALQPPRDGALRIGSLAMLLASFLRDSLVAGIDVARRAFSPAMPLRTGFVTFRVAAPPGDDRSLFTGLTSLMPGSVPAGVDASGDVIFHCLDTDQPVTEQLAAYEQRLADALGSPRAPRSAA